MVGWLVGWLVRGRWDAQCVLPAVSGVDGGTVFGGEHPYHGEANGEPASRLPGSDRYRADAPAVHQVLDYRTSTTSIE